MTCRDHLPRRCIVHPAPTSYLCFGSSKLSKIGEDVTETLSLRRSIRHSREFSERSGQASACKISAKTAFVEPAPVVPTLATGPSCTSRSATVLAEKLELTSSKHISVVRVGGDATLRRPLWNGFADCTAAVTMTGRLAN